MLVHYSCWKQDPLNVYTYNTCTRAGVDPLTRNETQKDQKGVILCHSQLWRVSEELF